MALIAALGALAASAAPPAGAAVQIGETFTPPLTGSCTASYTYPQSGSPGSQYAAPFAGVITSWSFQAPASSVPSLKFKVARPAGGNDFTIVGEEGPRTPTASALNTYPARIAVQAADVIGLYFVTDGFCGRSASGYSYHALFGDPPPGTTASFNGPVLGFQLGVSATLEPDCDSDGFGDETQDSSIDPRACDVTPPDTTISTSPKAKTKKKQATFEFTSSEPTSSFECTLDGKVFACGSPLIEKVGKGKHNFQVKAKDAAGNVDPTPATFDWKVKKKKKK